VTGLPLDELDPAALPAHTVIVAAPAKVNPYLRVLGKRDDGFHDLETVVLPIDLADRLQVHAYADETFRTLSLSLDVTGEPGLAGRIPVDETNLVLRAARALAEDGGVRGFAEIVLEKRVPVAAGLGGGSADAAAVLRALNELWGLGRSDEKLRALGAGIGSDVPALLAGGPCLARGRGERVEAVAGAGLDLAVVAFPFGVSSADAFGWWDEDGAVTGPDPAAALSALARIAAGDADAGAVAAAFTNDLEPPVSRRHEASRRTIELLEAAAVPAFMSGSGPTVVGVLPSGEESRLEPDVERELEGVAGRPVGYARTLLR
jgi:4-diphosphocytidyl-2-C-methyl-D-erythritol kinase